MVIVPLSCVAAESALDSKLFVLISTVGHFSLFPLLFGWAEFPIKVRLMVIVVVVGVVAGVAAVAAAAVGGGGGGGGGGGEEGVVVLFLVVAHHQH